ILVVVRVKIRAQIDVPLRPLERTKELSYIVEVGRACEYCCDHEGRIQDLSVTELLREIVRPAEERRSGNLVFDQKFHTMEQHSLGERQFDVRTRHELLEALNRGVMA